MSDWMEDKRNIVAVKLAANGNWYHALAGAGFTRFERPGEYCHLPWLRVHDTQLGKLFEAPLTQVEVLEYAAYPGSSSTK